jgi:hypothetical protein
MTCLSEKKSKSSFPIYATVISTTLAVSTLNSIICRNCWNFHSKIINFFEEFFFKWKAENIEENKKFDMKFSKLINNKRYKMEGLNNLCM